MPHLPCVLSSFIPTTESRDSEMDMSTKAIPSYCMCSQLYESVLFGTLNVHLLLMQEVVSGVVVVDSRSDTRHDGITLTIEGMVNLQLSPRSAGILESIVNSSKAS